MTPSSSSFRSGDGLLLHSQRWLPDAEPLLALVMVHGYGEHLGRYEHVARYFVERGCAVYAVDHRGHGQSEGKRASVRDFGEFLGDLHTFVGFVKTEQVGRPCFMLGHSMGALISLAYCLRYPGMVDALVVSGAPVRADANVPPLLIQVGKILTRIAPDLPLLSLTGDLLSRDPRVQAAFDADPLTWKRPMRVRLGTEINRTAAWVRDYLPRLTIPVLILHGAADAMVSPTGSETAYALAGSADKSLKLYAGLRHEIMNEPEQEQVLADIWEWVHARL